MEAKQDIWLKEGQSNMQLSQEAKKRKLKLTYQNGKNDKLVPVLIPEETSLAIEKLVEVRTSLDFPAANKYLFPSTGKSVDHASTTIWVMPKR